MSYQKAFQNFTWENKPSTRTPLYDVLLNRVNNGVDTNDTRIVSLDTAKLEITEAYKLLKDFDLDPDTGIITITWYNDTKAIFDTKLEKLAVNFTYDSTTQQLIITLDDGTKQYVDMSALITQFEFLTSNTVEFSVDDSGKVKAEIIDGSIDESKFRPNYLADIKIEVGKAQTSASAALDSENNSYAHMLDAEAWAKGTKADTPVQSTDAQYQNNSKYWSEVSKSWADKAESVVDVHIATVDTVGIVKPDGVSITIEEDGTIHGVPQTIVDSQLSTTSTNPLENRVITRFMFEVLDNLSNGKVITMLTDHTGDAIVDDNNEFIYGPKSLVIGG